MSSGTVNRSKDTIFETVNAYIIYSLKQKGIDLNPTSYIDTQSKTVKSNNNQTDNEINNPIQSVQAETKLKDDHNSLFNQVDKCDKQSDNPLETCNILKRLVYGLQFYTSLDIINQVDEFSN
eukprot:280404_1